MSINGYYHYQNWLAVYKSVLADSSGTLIAHQGPAPSEQRDTILNIVNTTWQYQQWMEQMFDVMLNTNKINAMVIWICKANELLGNYILKYMCNTTEGGATDVESD